MLADPQSITINGTAHTTPKIDTLKETNVYSDLANGVTIYATQRVTGNDKRRRTTVSVVKEKIAADVLTAVNQRVNSSVTFSAAFPAGFTATEMEQIAAGLITWLTATSNANLKKILAGER